MNSAANGGGLFAAITGFDLITSSSVSVSDVAATGNEVTGTPALHDVDHIGSVVNITRRPFQVMAVALAYR